MEPVRSPRDDLEWMDLHVRTLFRCDTDGSLLSVNEAVGGEAPRVFVGSTPIGRRIWTRSDVPATIAQRVERWAGEESAELGEELTACPAALVDILTEHAPVEATWAGPAFRFPRDVVMPDNVVAIQDDNAALLEPLFPDWLLDVPDCQPMYAVVEDGAAVSLCASVRKGARAEEAGVETSAAFRGRGLAARTVAAWASAVRGRGREPLYSTSWTNRPSRSVAAKLGLVSFGADLHVR